MDGRPSPLGYDVKDRKLVVNPAEAETVRHIYRRYLELGSVLDAARKNSKRDGHRQQAAGRPARSQPGGKPLARGALYLMLQNRIYRGEIVHKENELPRRARGDRRPSACGTRCSACWPRTGSSARPAPGAERPSLLAGLVYDDAGERMTPTHANKKGTRYRYYVSQSLIRGTRSSAPRGRRVPAGDLEGTRREPAAEFPRERERTSTAPSSTKSATSPNAPTSSRVQRTSVDAGPILRGGEARHPPCAGRSHRLHERDGRGRHLAEAPPGDPTGAKYGDQHLRRAKEDSEPTIVLGVPARLKRAGVEMKLLVDGAGPRRKPDRSLGRLLAQAHRYNAIVMRGEREVDLHAGRGSRRRAILLHAHPAAELPRSGYRQDHPARSSPARSHRQAARQQQPARDCVVRSARAPRRRLTSFDESECRPLARSGAALCAPWR